MHYYSSLPSLLAVAASLLTSQAAAKPEQIRAVQDPIFHYYLQAYPQDREHPCTPQRSLRSALP